ncbi:antibiotic biosynthesis monooxygenase family protein [Enterobacter sp. Bisph1]|uniref:putative quinol monooxygenase n=1 Tax=Enterobacter sp. Bisph1 TaxID=1274399 RepID=UPI00057C1911|nr:antibiotic biosynthesis monooxygenase family protein [Enterobacter sp. Bisph1]
MNDAITVVATITAHAGSREKVAQALKTVERDVQGEPGCEFYQLHLNRENDHQFVMIERWASMQMLEQHSQAAPFKALVSAIDGLADLHVTTLTRNI